MTDATRDQNDSPNRSSRPTARRRQKARDLADGSAAPLTATVRIDRPRPRPMELNALGLDDRVDQASALAIVAEPEQALPALVPNASVVPTRIIARLRALGLVSEGSLVVTLMLVALVAHGVNMFEYPSFTWLADEGTYVSEAWAVLRLGQLAHYTYMYGHVPGGWILLAALTLVTGGPRTFDMPVNTGRVLMLLLHVAMVPMLYYLARRLHCERPAAALAAFVFSVSPLAIFYQRLFLLDNVMLFWTLLSLVLLLNGEGRLSLVALSGLSFGLALLSKETDLFLIPVLLFMVWRWRRPHQGRFAVIAWLLPMVVVTSWYPLYAILKGELLPEGFAVQILGHTLQFSPGPHVSLLEALLWQGSRGGGGILDPNNLFWINARVFWLPKDPLLVVGGIVAIGLNLLIGLRRHRVFVAGLLGLFPLLYLDHGGIVFQHYILFAIPFLCLNLAVLASTVFRLLPARAAAVLAIVIAGSLLGQYWRAGAMEPLYNASPSQTGRDVIVWIKQNLPSDSMIITRDSFWPDLHEPGLGGGVFPNVHDHWQVATNPAVRYDIFHDDWHSVDYLLMMADMPPLFRDSNNKVALDAYDNACRLKIWMGGDGNAIELWKVDKTGALRDLVYSGQNPTCGLPPWGGDPILPPSEIADATLLVPDVALTPAMPTVVPTVVGKPVATPLPVATETTVATPSPSTPSRAIPILTAPIPAVGRDGEPLPRTYVVKKGDTLSEIAYRVYGDLNRWRDIFAANSREISSPDRLLVGQSLLLPDLVP